MNRKSYKRRMKVANSASLGAISSSSIMKIDSKKYPRFTTIRDAFAAATVAEYSEEFIDRESLEFKSDRVSSVVEKSVIEPGKTDEVIAKMHLDSEAKIAMTAEIASMQLGEVAALTLELIYELMDNGIIDTGSTMTNVEKGSTYPNGVKVDVNQILTLLISKVASQVRFTPVRTGMPKADFFTLDNLKTVAKGLVSSSSDGTFRQISVWNTMAVGFKGEFVLEDFVLIEEAGVCVRPSIVKLATYGTVTPIADSKGVVTKRFIFTASKELVALTSQEMSAQDGLSDRLLLALAAKEGADILTDNKLLSSFVATAVITILDIFKDGAPRLFDFGALKDIYDSFKTKA